MRVFEIEILLLKIERELKRDWIAKQILMNNEYIIVGTVAMYIKMIRKRAYK